MRNLKRALSLALASVMLLGMMVIGSSAAVIDDFKDKNEVTELDAVAITSEIGMFAGYEDGTFGPSKVVTRAEMAVIICKMLYGSDVNVSQFAESTVFTDVPTWASGYVNLCASLGIVAGVGGGRYSPNATVTTAQAALMLCKTLGYFKNESEYGNNWMLAATAKATSLKIYGNLRLTATAGLSRENVAVMVFNALTEAVPVDYNETFNTYYNASAAWTQGVTYSYLDTLGYKNFDLVYKTDTGTDNFGRPVKVWGTGSAKTVDSTNGELVDSGTTLLTKNEIIKAPEDYDYIYTAATDAEVLYDDADVDSNSDWTIYVDGVKQTLSSSSSDLQPPQDVASRYIQPGQVAELFSTNNGQSVTLVVINYYAGEVTRTSSDEDGRYVSVGYRGGSAANPGANKFYTANFSVDDVVYYTVGRENNENKIQSMALADKVSGEVTATGSGTPGAVFVDGTKYNLAAKTITTGELAVGADWSVYLNPHNFVLWGEEDAAAAGKYLYVENAVDSVDGVSAKVVFADGTKATIAIDEYNNSGTGVDTTVIKPGMVLSYSQDGNTYQVKPVAYTSPITTVSNAVIKSESRTITVTGGTAIKVDSDTKFVDIESGKVYVGFEDVPDYDVARIAYAGKTSGLADVVYIVEGEANDDATYVYFVGTNANTYSKYIEYTKSYIDGVQTNVKVKDGATVVNLDGTSNVKQYAVYKVNSTNSDGYITKMTQQALSTTDLVDYAGSKGFTMDNAASTYYSIDNDTVFVTIDMTQSKDDNKVSAGSWRDIIETGKMDNTATYVTVVKHNSDNYAEYVYIIIQAYTPTATVNKTSLQAAITAAQALVQADYTAASWTSAAVPTYLSAAQTENANTAATQANVDTATANLNTAIAALVLKTNLSTLGVTATGTGTAIALTNLPTFSTGATVTVTVVDSTLATMNPTISGNTITCDPLTATSSYTVTVSVTGDDTYTGTATATFIAT